MQVMAMRQESEDDQVFENTRRVAAELMRKHELRQEDLAPILDITQQTLSDRLRGRSRFTLAEVQRLSRFFNVSPLVFFNGVIPQSRCTYVYPGQRAWTEPRSVAA